MEQKLITLTPLCNRIQKEDNLNEVWFEDEIGPGNGRHYYEIQRTKDQETGEHDNLCVIQFQKGPRQLEDSIPGVTEADLLEIVRHRLQCFLDGPYACEENKMALMHIEGALIWLNKRKEDRKFRGVLGKNEK